MRTAIATLVLLSSLVAGTANAQSRPSFSGQWVLLSLAGDASAASTELNVMESRGSFEIERRFSRLHYSRQTYLLGRREVFGDGSRTFEILRWENDTLVFEIGTVLGQASQADERLQRREVWSLDSTDILRLTVTEFGPSGPKTTTALYHRRNAPKRPIAA